MAGKAAKAAAPAKAAKAASPAKSAGAKAAAPAKAGAAKSPGAGGKPGAPGAKAGAAKAGAAKAGAAHKPGGGGGGDDDGPDARKKGTTSVGTTNGGDVAIDRNFKIWEKGFTWPTPIPGVTFAIDPSLSASVGAAINVTNGERTYHAGVTGGITVGLHGGIPKVGTVYLEGDCSATADLVVTFDKKGKPKIVKGSVDVTSSATIGIDLNDKFPDWIEKVEWSHELGSCDLFGFVGFEWKPGGVTKRGDFELGKQPKAALKKIKSKIDWVKDKVPGI